MNVNILNENLELIKVLDNFDSLLWNTRYNSVGDFQLICDKKYFSLMKEGNKIQNPQDDEYIGIIEYVKVETDERKKTNRMTVKGRMIESILSQRVVMEGAYRKNIQPAEFVSIIVDRNAINPTEPERKIAGLIMGTKPDSDLGTIDYENAYSNLLDVIERVTQNAEMGFKIKTDMENKTYTLNLYKGRNLTQGVADNAVVLSKNFDNVYTSEYERNSRGYKNVVYIKGEGEFKTSLSFGNYTGLDRREMFVDQTHISRTLSNGTVLNDTDYAKLLQDTVVDKLKNAAKEEILYNSLNLQSNYKYKEDFDLGDLVTCSDPDLGFEMDLRIVEINQVWDRKKGYSIYLHLGETKTNLKNYVENIVFTDRKL